MGNKRVITDHEHEWKGYINESSSGVTPMASYLCSYPSCRQELSIEKVEAMLNEHAKLKRENEDAKKMACAVADVIKHDGEWDARGGYFHDANVPQYEMDRLIDAYSCYEDALADTQEKEVADE